MIIKEVQCALRKLSDKKAQTSSERYHKEEVKYLGVKVPEVRKISKEFYKKAKRLPKKEMFKECEKLLKSSYEEEKLVGFDWAFQRKKEFSEEDFKIFQSWLKKYVSNWAICDECCSHVLGFFILQFPKFIKKTKTWAKSKNMWVRRAAAVALIPSVRRDKNIEMAFEIANILFHDPEDLVQKAYGWLLKETSKIYPERVFEYVLSHKKDMPRTALRYAIEKLPAEKKKIAMKK